MIDRSRNDQHQRVIDVLSLSQLLIISLDGAASLHKLGCVLPDACECSEPYLCLIFIVNRVCEVCVYGVREWSC